MAPLRRGVVAALWTPVTPNGRLLTGALRAHLRFLRGCGVHGILALGSTGEFARFPLEKRKEILAKVAELAAPLPVLANITNIRLDEVIELGRFAKRAGVVGVAVMPPPFFPVSQADMLEFFLRAAEGVDLPFYLYNFPELTSNRIGLETIAAFADRADMVAIKQSGGEFSYHPALIALGKEKKFGVFSGADTRLTEVFALGGVGCVGGLVNFVPDLMVPIYDACTGPEANDLRATIPAARMRQVGQLIEQLTFPLNVAAGLEARGLEPGAPKTVVSRESKKLYHKLTKDVHSQFRAWKLPVAG